MEQNNVTGRMGVLFRTCIISGVYIGTVISRKQPRLLDAAS
jgi:hypothetical protein